MALLRAYEAIVINYAKSLHKDYDINGAFFVNSNLKRWIGAAGKTSIDYSLFCKYAETPEFSSHKCRNMFATFLGASTSLVLRESAGN